MKHRFYSFLTFAFITLVNISSANAQQVNAKIQEVYGDKTQELVINDPVRLDFLNDLLDNRIKIIESPLSDNNEKEPKLSSVELLNKYNPALTRDAVFDPLNFNPLKYNFNFFPKTVSVYRVDNTNYLIVIQAQTLKKD
jgi:hypothetical protein